jgi:hypothetical protein
VGSDPELAVPTTDRAIVEPCGGRYFIFWHVTTEPDSARKHMQNNALGDKGDVILPQAIGEGGPISQCQVYFTLDNVTQ